MVKTVDDSVLDAALNEIINNADKIVLCDGAPSNYSDATTAATSTGNELGNKAISSADFSGPTDGDTSGRKLTVNAITGITVDHGGTLDHVALIDDDASRLLHVVSTASQGVNAGDTVDLDPYDEELEDPA